MRIVSVVPMKLNNCRLPGKNTMRFTNGKPLCYYVLSSLLSIDLIDEVYVYCSDESIFDYIPEGVLIKPRNPIFDLDSAKMNDILFEFSNDIKADIYVMSHVTAPFIRPGSITKGIEALISGEYDSSFSAKLIQDFLWDENGPMNYDLESIPRTQDLHPIWMETSGFYIYGFDLIQRKRRVGNKPYIVEVNEIESVDIDEYDDFFIADALYNHIEDWNEWIRRE